MRGFVNQSRPFVNNVTDIYIALGGDINDACGTPFNTTVVNFQQPHRLEGELAVDNVVYSTDSGATIEDSTANIVAAFTAPVPALTAAMFDVYGVDANLTAFSMANDDGSVWTFSVTVPVDYYGPATVYMNQAGAEYLLSLQANAVVPTPVDFTKASQEEQPTLGQAFTSSPAPTERPFRRF
jgi:hypothetical protein